jgi:heme-degrading monooxygenase HmoA
MHIQIVNFHLEGPSEGEFRAKCDEIAPLYAELPGLISKVWLANSRTNTYGGIYTWESRAAMEAFAQSELFRAVAANPAFAGVTSTDFDVLEDPTRVTHGPVPVGA